MPDQIAPLRISKMNIDGRGSQGQGRTEGLTLAERRGSQAPASVVVPDSPDEGLFQRPPRWAPAPSSYPVDAVELGPGKVAAAPPPPPPPMPLPMGPPPAIPAGESTDTLDATTTTTTTTSTSPLVVPPLLLSTPSRHVSTNTTRANRGSPPPPETPSEMPEGQDIEARFAATGLASPFPAGGGISAAPQARATPYREFQQQQQQQQQQRQSPVQASVTQQQKQQELEQDMQRLHVSASPPPAYSTLPGDGSGVGSQPPATGSVMASKVQQQQQQQPGQHPAFSNDPPQTPQEMPRTGSVHSQTKPRPQPLWRPQPAQAPPQVQPQMQQPQQPQQIQTPQMGQVPATQIVTQSQYPPMHALQSPMQPIHPVYSQLQSPALASPLQSPMPLQMQQPQIPQTSLRHVNTIASVAGSVVSVPPSSPPPLPEGWIANLDTNSGHYYYIHLPTQSTQWEFPKGPTPLSLQEAPLSPSIKSPGLSTFGQSLASPSLTFHHPLASPAMSTFGQPISPAFSTFQSIAPMDPLPQSGVDQFKVAPTNGVYFGPCLRYTNIDMERCLWYGSILIVTDAPYPPTIHIHQSIDLSPNPRQLKAVNIATHQRWTFYKYSVDLVMDDLPAKWTYAITSHLGCTRYEFVVAGRFEQNWRFILTSGNDFSLSVSAAERARLGGVGYMWKDILQKHNECGGFHAQLGLGGLINADRIWKELPLLKQWLSISGKETRKAVPWTAVHEEEVRHAYFHYYTSNFDQPNLREAFAQIPYVQQIDDHDIFDGYGSFPDHMQQSNMFKNIGRIATEMYLLFQHHTTPELLRQGNNESDLFTVTGNGWHFVKLLGPAIAVVGMDCRSERTQRQVMGGATYQGLFPKVAMLPTTVQHVLWMVPGPVVFPRLDTAAQVVTTVATGKKAMTGAYNALGKATSSVAGVVGAKAVVGSGFDSFKRAVGKGGLLGSVLSPFGDLDLLDALRDMWTHESKDLERTYLVRTLQAIAQARNFRMTLLSGAAPVAPVAAAGVLHDPTRPGDHKTMYQLIASPVVDGPPASYVLRMLQSAAASSSAHSLYIPPNGQRSISLSTTGDNPGFGGQGQGQRPTDTKEDMLDLFQTDVTTGHPNIKPDSRRLMPRRNYVAVVAYDPDAIAAGIGLQKPMGIGARCALAADYFVQGEGAFGTVVKYGPVIVPCLEKGQ